ncbi:predicted protein [Histoplasma capsulatum G186AR]|uniref:Uncharacterized protein n=1 Tax=Ajellomyces capsulatus (strain G186AR / H82 / ATCC MYA-2454 / RMSCC 2432) TaxID=447093 RepID=C0NUX1_AJECG|nr:uncharacterized protein HCBG_06735 [Histoplasma capsulatum G186AR]EEH04784.1 predicted protein [Histoplasma capsulatum G186AR]
MTNIETQRLYHFSFHPSSGALSKPCNNASDSTSALRRSWLGRTPKQADRHENGALGAGLAPGRHPGKVPSFPGENGAREQLPDHGSSTVPARLWCCFHGAVAENQLASIAYYCILYSNTRRAASDWTDPPRVIFIHGCQGKVQGCWLGRRHQMLSFLSPSNFHSTTALHVVETLLHHRKTLLYRQITQSIQGQNKSHPLDKQQQQQQRRRHPLGVGGRTKCTNLDECSKMIMIFDVAVHSGSRRLLRLKRAEQ